MATSKTDESPEKQADEIEAIRSIILGEREKKFDQKITGLEKITERLKDQQNKKLEALDLRFTREIDGITRSIDVLNDRLEKTGKEIEKQFRSLNSQLDRISGDLEAKKLDRESLATQLTHLANTIRKK